MTDTDKIYDKCCGQPPHIKARIGFKSNHPEFQVSCESCGNATQWWPYKSQIMVEWNRSIRRAS